ncbi:hypothetical protein L916_08065, partial [Phytophthora nicotianae]
ISTKVCYLKTVGNANWKKTSTRWNGSHMCAQARRRGTTVYDSNTWSSGGLRRAVMGRRD